MGVSLWFSVKERIVVELRVPLGAAALRVSNFNFELMLLGLRWDRGSWGPALNKATGLFIVSQVPCPHRPPPRSQPIFFLFRYTLHSPSCPWSNGEEGPVGGRSCKNCARSGCQWRGEGGIRTWAPVRGLKVVSCSAGHLYQGLVVQKQDHTEFRRCPQSSCQVCI